MQGDYDRLIRPVEAQLVRAVWRVLQDATEADDAFQDALRRIWDRIDEVRVHPAPGALVVRIGYQAAYDRLRKRIRRRRLDGDSGPLDSAAASAAADQLESFESRTAILTAVAELSDLQAGAFLLRVLDDAHYKDIGAAVGCSESTARTHVERARQHLARSLSHLRS